MEAAPTYSYGASGIYFSMALIAAASFGISRSILGRRVMSSELPHPSPFAKLLALPTHPSLLGGSRGCSGPSVMNGCFLLHKASELPSSPASFHAIYALQRTAPRVTVAAILARTRLVRSWRCPTSVASFCAPPSQLPRHAPPSLSLGSLGASPCYLQPTPTNN